VREIVRAHRASISLDDGPGGKGLAAEVRFSL
jgi:two-component system sensor histidine kinase TctE